MSLPGYDAWKTSGRYSSEAMVVRCSECEEETPVVFETEYGATTWSPEECKHCGCPFDGSEDCAPDEPPDPEPYDDWEVDWRDELR